MLGEAVAASEMILEAEHGEEVIAGSWTSVDLIWSISSLSRLREALFLRRDYRFYDSPVSVNPRAKIRADGGWESPPVQNILLTAGQLLNLKPEAIGLRQRTGDCGDEPVSRLLILALNKFACLDPSESASTVNRQTGRNDAMNGLRPFRKRGRGDNRTPPFGPLSPGKGKGVFEEALHLPKEFLVSEGMLAARIKDCVLGQKRFSVGSLPRPDPFGTELLKKSNSGELSFCLQGWK